MLLLNISFTTTYINTGPTEQIVSGIAPFNASLASGKNESLILPSYFSRDMQGLLLDPTIAISVTPTANGCTADETNCFAYVLPGQMVSLFADEDGELVSPLDYFTEQLNGATLYLSVGGPAYQIEYFPMQDDIEFDSSDCEIFGAGGSGFKVCLKNNGTDLAAGTLFMYAHF